MKTITKVIFMVASLIGIVSCTPDKSELTPKSKSTSPSHSERAFPNEASTLATIEFNGKNMVVQEFEDYHACGDMIFKKESLDGQEKAVIVPWALWPESTVYYTIDPYMPNPERVTQAIEHWNSNTNLDFIPRTNEHAYVAFIATSDGCFAEVGYQGRKQHVYVGNNCSTGNMIHEIGHAIGLNHEHTRPDRDDYVTINYENIMPGHEYNFEIIWGIPLTPFDFNSIMMYDSWEWSIGPNNPVLFRNDIYNYGSLFYAQRNGLSPHDLIAVDAMYPPPSYWN